MRQVEPIRDMLLDEIPGGLSDIESAQLLALTTRLKTHVGSLDLSPAEAEDQDSAGPTRASDAGARIGGGILHPGVMMPARLEDVGAMIHRPLAEHHHRRSSVWPGSVSAQSTRGGNAGVTVRVTMPSRSSARSVSVSSAGTRHRWSASAR